MFKKAKFFWLTVVTLVISGLFTVTFMIVVAMDCINQTKTELAYLVGLGLGIIVFAILSNAICAIGSSHKIEKSDND